MPSKFHNYGPIGIAIAEGSHAKAAEMVVVELVKAGNNQTAAAKAIGVTDRTMRRWIATLRAAEHDVCKLAADKIAAVAAKKDAKGKPKKRRAAA
jgi:transposase